MDLYQLVDASQEPILRTHDWIQEATKSGVGLPHALNLASVNEKGQPSSRMVLLKGLSDEGLVFFTDCSFRNIRHSTYTGPRKTTHKHHLVLFLNSFC